jgi:hypothetical protein
VGNDIRARRYRRWTAIEDRVICGLYGQMTAGDLAIYLDRTARSVEEHAWRLGLSKQLETIDQAQAMLRAIRRPGACTLPVSTVAPVPDRPGWMAQKTYIVKSVIHDYFSVMDCAERAYVLGLLAADGYISSAHPRICIGLQAKDAHLVAYVRDRLNPAANLHRKTDGFTTLQVTSRQMAADLARYGIVPRKSRILTWPSQLGNLLRPYLLGYFDGDGSMYLPRDRHGRERPGWTVCSGTEQFLVDMRDYIRTATGVDLQKIQHRAGANLWQATVTGLGAVVVSEFLHLDGLGLERKRFPARVVERYGPG